MTDPRTAERLEVVGRWLAERGGSATPGDVGAALGLNANQQAAAVRGLREAKLAAAGRSLVELTASGLARFGGMEQASAGHVLDQVLEGWPARHRAFVELGVCAVIARHHLRAERPSPHPGLMIVGGTGSGKTACGVLICRLFGLAPVTMTRNMQTMTENPLGRRTQEGRVYRFEPSELTRQPFALLDELDKADPAVQKATWPVFDGNTRLFIEDADHDIAPTPMVTANPPARGDRLGSLPPHARRRSVVFDAGSARDYTREHVLRFGAVYDWAPAPDQRLDLETLRPPKTHSPTIRAWIEECAQHFLTDAGREEFPGAAALELLALGRLALLDGQVSDEIAAAQTVAAYLTVHESIPGQVDPRAGWSQVLGDWSREYSGAAGIESLAAALSRAEAARERAGAQAAVGRRRKARVDDAVREQGAALAERLRLAFDALDGRRLTHASTDQRATAKGLQRLLKDYRARAGKVSTAKGLAEVTDLATDPLERAGQLRAQIDQTRAEVETTHRVSIDDRKRERVEGKQRAAWEAQRRREQRSNQGAVLKQIRSQVRELERLWNRKAPKPGKTPLDELLQVHVSGRPLLTWQQAPELPPRTGRLARIPRLPQGGWWVIAGSGATISRAQLMAWGPGTQSVLAPMLTFLRQQEAGLELELGRTPRQRPNLPRSAPQRRALNR